MFANVIKFKPFNFIFIYIKIVSVFNRYIDKEGQLYSQFLDLISIPNGTANTIVAAIKEVLTKKEIPTSK